MNKIDIVKSAINWDNPDRESYLSDDFQFTDALGSPPMDRGSWLAMGQLMQSAFPDISTNIEDIREEGDDVVVTHHLSGTFANDIDLSAMGMGVIPATGAAVDFPTDTMIVSFDGAKISKIHDPSSGPDAGMPGFLRAIGKKA